MATRMIATELWTDKDFRKIKSIKTRYLWIYLLSCPMSKTCGVFHLPMDIIVFDTRMSEEEVEKSLQELTINNFIYHDKESEEIAIYNYPKYNINNMGKPMVDCITRELDIVSNKKLISRVVDSLKDYQKTLGNIHKIELVESIIEVYNNYVPEDDKPVQEVIEVVDLKEKTIIKERVNTTTNTTTNTNTNSETIHDSSHDSYNDSVDNKQEKVKKDWCSANQDELF